MQKDDSFAREWQKMLAGEVYEAGDHRFFDALISTRLKIKRYNDTSPDDIKGLESQLHDLLGSCGERVVVNQPFRCDYGCNIHIGHDVVLNFNITILDEADVRIGNHVLIGPNVSIYTACHPVDADSRRTLVQWAKPVNIGDDVWIGGGATILPGVTVGKGAVVAAAAVVTKDVPPFALVAGNPARVIKKLD